MITESLFKSIQDGKKGLNKGLSTGLPKLDTITYGLQRKWMTVVFADSGAGKSSFTNYIGIYSPFKQYIASGRKIPLHFLLFSFEMSAEVVFAKLLSTYLYDEYGEIVSYEEILSLNRVLTDDHFDLIQKSLWWLEELEKLCTIQDKPVNGDGIYAITKEWTRQFGEYETFDDNHEEYRPNDSQQYLIVILDHVSLLKSSGTPKTEIDKATTYLIHLRNKCGLTIFLVQQANRNLKQGERKTNGEYLRLDDLRDSSDTSNGAESVIGLYNPYREKLSRCEGYDIKQLRDNFRLCTILKHRFGRSDVSMGLNFFGEVSLFKDMPTPDKINDYSKFTSL